MCEHGTTFTLSVPIPASDSHTGQFRWADKPVDSCIADIVSALNAGGVLTRSCCCGHGKHRPQIILHDGRSLVVGRTIAEAGLLAGPVRRAAVGVSDEQ